MNLLESIINLEKVSHLQNMSCVSVEDFPCHVFAKDKKGKYLNCNNTLVRSAGMAKHSDFLGFTDLELCWSSYSSLALTNDQEVMETGKPKYETLKFCDYNNNLIDSTCMKYPLRTRSNKIIGVVGFAILKKTHELVNFDKISLTKREYYCLFYLARSMTAQQIANTLFISKRTVEKHLFNIKLKFNCKSKSELIEKAIKNGFINIDFFNVG